MSAHLRQRARGLLHSLFGEVHWRSPPWLNWLSVHLRGRALATLACVCQNPRRAALAGGYVLDHSVEEVYSVPEYPRELRIAQQGSLLAV
jgi:hypothetical protein